MSQANLQVWLEEFCAPRSAIAGGVVMVAPDAQTSPSLAAAWPSASGHDPRLIAAAAAAVEEQRGAAGNRTPKRYENDGVISLPLKSRNKAIGAVAFQLRAANADSLDAPVAGAVVAPGAAVAHGAGSTTRAAPSASQAHASVMHSAMASSPSVAPPANPAAHAGPASAAAAASAAGTALAHPAADAGAMVRLHAAVLSRETFAEAAAAAATGLAAALGFSRVAIGIVAGGYCRVIAISHGTLPAAGSALARGLARAMDEAVTQEATIAVPAPPGARARVTLAHAQLARRGDGAVCTIPLSRAARVFGAVTLERAHDAAPLGDEIARCEQFVCLIGPSLDLMHADERPWHARLHARAGRRGAWAGKALGGAVLALAGACLAIPVEHWIGAPARIEGAVQRVVAAPTDGFIKVVHVRPGDSVAEGQLLAEMAEQDLELERRKLEAEVTQHESALRAALARDDRAQYATAAARADSAAAQLALIEEQRARARLTAPFAGVVIKGDLTQSLGAPVTRGDALITIAPAGRYRLIVEVDERDMPHLAGGAPGVLALAALPEARIDFRVARVTPVANARDGRNAFEVEGSLGTLPPGARPGLLGVAKIHAGERAFGWVWTHRLVGWLRLRLWSLGL